MNLGQPESIEKSRRQSQQRRLKAKHLPKSLSMAVRSTPASYRSNPMTVGPRTNFALVQNLSLCLNFCLLLTTKRILVYNFGPFSHIMAFILIWHVFGLRYCCSRFGTFLGRSPMTDELHVIVVLMSHACISLLHCKFAWTSLGGLPSPTLWCASPLMWSAHSSSRSHGGFVYTQSIPNACSNVWPAARRPQIMIGRNSKHSNPDLTSEDWSAVRHFTSYCKGKMIIDFSICFVLGRTVCNKICYLQKNRHASWIFFISILSVNYNRITHNYFRIYG